METKDLTSIIDKILWGKSLVEIESGEDINIPFILRSLTIKETNYVNYIYDKEYENAIINGILRQRDLQDIYIANGVWSQDNDILIERLSNAVKQIKNKIKDLEFHRASKKHYEKELEKANKELNNLMNDKSSLFAISAEYRAEQIKRGYIVFMSTETLDEKPYWNGEKKFLSETDQTLIYNLTSAYYQNNMFDEKTIRKIARNPMWSFRWKIAKSGADLFGKPITDWSEMQNILVYWSQFYDQVFESPDRPMQTIIDDDFACDAWFDEQIKKYNSSGNNEKNIFGTKKAKTNKFHQEQFIMVDRQDTESIKKIQDMNPESVRARLRAEHEFVKKAGKRVSEWKLRKGQNYE